MREILHVTDVHFGKDHLPDRSDGLIELSRQRKPDLVVCSGDVTKRAKPSQFREARQFIDALAAPTIVVPGNHDVPLFRVWERVFAPYGAYRKHFENNLEPRWQDEEVLAVGVNSAHGWTFTGGWVKGGSLARAAAALRENGGRRFAIVVVHHQMIPVPGYGSEVVFRNARKTAEVLLDAGADLIVSGHVHLSYLGSSSEITDAPGEPIPVLFSGTGSSSRGRGPEKGRNTCHWLEVSDDRVAVTRLEWSSETSRFEPTGENTSLPRRQAS